MSDRGYDSPERAAMVGFPPEHCRVVASRVEGDAAYVLLDTGSRGQPYLYGVNCSRANARWFEGTSGNGPGWAHVGDDPEVGILSLWGEAPPEAERVRVEFQGDVFEEPVGDGVYLTVWWRVPPPRDWPRVIAFRIGGRWVDQEQPAELEEPALDDELHFAAQEGDITRVRELLADGHSLDAFDEIAKTPLHYAAERGDLDVIRVLLDAGADVNANDKPRIGNTPLRDVADQCSLAVATLLVEAGADPRIPGWMQLTALHKAESRKDEEGQRVYALLKRVADRLNNQ
jgi:hypothetical protein